MSSLQWSNLQRVSTASTNLERYAWLSIAAALATIGLKTLAWWLTDSVGLLSDALESIVNLAAALLALSMLRLAASPPDEDHPYGFSKAEYFAAGIEGALIVLAAAGILASAIPRLIEPRMIDAPVLGLALTTAASAINLGVATLLIRVGRREHSITLEADGKHLMTDVWTSVGVIVGVALVFATGWLRLDPLVALAVAAHI
ncbi:MAG TPA: cation diffusion facilitator family transporter, partial [Burkholderiales bacterium]|nr:cation diffusion facilitator family transporter [Burkholderiales bacterium]